MNATATLEIKTAKLAKSSGARLRQLETVIERGQQTFISVGQALAEIRESRLYRDTYATFEDYCQDRWKWTASHARTLISSAKTVDSMKSVSTETLPVVHTERHARELSAIKNPVARAQAWQEVNQIAQKTETTVTTKLIQSVVQKHVQIHGTEVVQPDREADGMDIVKKLNVLRQSLSESQKIFDPFLAACVRDIKHNCTLSDDQREEIVLFAVESSCAHTIQDITDDCRLVESEVKTITQNLVAKNVLYLLPRHTVGGSANQTLIFSRRKPCSCV